MTIQIPYFEEINSYLGVRRQIYSLIHAHINKQTNKRSHVYKYKYAYTNLRI